MKIPLEGIFELKISKSLLKSIRIQLRKKITQQSINSFRIDLVILNYILTEKIFISTITRSFNNIL